MKFKKHQVWPNKKKWNSTTDWIARSVLGMPRINKKTKIVSMGSCFAREVKKWLLCNEFNYLLGENEKCPWVSSTVFKGDRGMKPYQHASVAWERVYNTFSFRQIIEYSFQDTRIDERILEVKCRGHGDRSFFSDLLRTRILYPDHSTAVSDIEDHAKSSRQVLCEAEVLILTLGLTEIWQSAERNIVISSHPGTHYDIPADFRCRYQENLDNLLEGLALLRTYNQEIKVIVTVSPVHLLATSRSDMDVISASCNSKSTLRAVADVFQLEDGIHYFPSYEIASITSAMDSVNVYPDNHHVSEQVVERIMQVFKASAYGLDIRRFL
ncbi:MAG: GSCFA domain-containing protein [Opitutae bacterium]|nr:GSCFA domain-containing protein [Opitutae bacterium]MBT7854333.1 GSCFA domain-containing protein [Opitutae bacterium]